MADPEIVASLALQLQEHGAIITDRSRDDLLPDFSKATLTDRYLFGEESYQDRFATVARTYAGNHARAERIYEAISRLWFMPATPILANGGTGRGLPISCLTANMRVVTPFGLVEICKLREGDEVLTHKGRFRPIVKTATRLSTNDLFQLTVEGALRPLEITGNHPILTDHGWTRVDKLDVDKYLSCIFKHQKLAYARISECKRIRHTATVYDLQVEEDESFVVENVVVHNCYLNEANDSMRSIADLWYENIWLASGGGGTGSYFGNVRGLGESIGKRGKSSGVVPFLKVVDSLTLAVSQGCVDGRTEILTEKGWVRFDQLDERHGKVAQVNEDKTMSFVEVESYHKYRVDGEVDYYSNPGNTINHVVTKNHRMVYESLSRVDGRREWTNTLRIKESQQFNPNRDNRMYVGAPIVGGTRKSLTPFERILIAYQADGTTHPCGNSNGAICGEVCYNFHFSKERKIMRLIELCDDAGLRYTTGRQTDDTVNICVRFPIDRLPSKRLADWIGDFSQYSVEWFRSFVDEVVLWDGKIQNSDGLDWTSGSYFSTDKENADTVAAIVTLAGYKSFEVTQGRDFENRLPLHTVHVLKDRVTVGGEEITKSSIPFDGYVYCVSVPSGMFMCRRNGAPIVTGNSLRRGSAAIYLPVDHPEILEFIDLRRPTGGDVNRRCLNLHHGVIVSDAFMMAVDNDDEWHLRSPHTREIITTVSARDVWIRLMTARLEQGEPYIIFGDTVNKNRPPVPTALDLQVKTSNLCVHGSTRILTENGYRQISDLAGQDVVLWNGAEWSLSRVEQTADDASLRKIRFSNEAELLVTDKHEFYIQNEYHQKAVKVTASDLRPGDRLEKWKLPVVTTGKKYEEDMYTSGFMSADGTYDRDGNPLIWVYPSKQPVLTRISFRAKTVRNRDCSGKIGVVYHTDTLLSKFKVPLDGDLHSRLDWLAGYMDGDGSVSRNGDNQSLQFSSTDLEFVKDIRLLLTTLGVDCSISLSRDEGYCQLPDGKGGSAMYKCNNVYRGCISSVDTQHLISIGFLPRRLELVAHKPNRDARRFVMVVSNEADVCRDKTFCANEPKRHRIMLEGIETGNCAEITLPTGLDHLNNMRTAVCCLSSLNLETWDEWKDEPILIEDIMYFLDNVLSEFIETAPDDYAQAKYAAYRERSVGLGVMGFHSFLIKNNIPFGSVMAKVWNKKFFKHIRSQADAASVKIAHDLGPCPDAADAGLMERFSHKLAIAPTASISIICGATSAGIEPIPANVYPHKTLSGSFTCRNKYLERELIKHNENTPERWEDIAKHQGSVQHLDFLDDPTKEVFKTALEIDQRWIIEHAADRQPFICQAQSVNLFLPADVHKRDLHHIHVQAWKKGLKSLYYCRSRSVLSAGGAQVDLTRDRVDYEECLACQ